MQDIKLWIINSYISDYWFRPKPIKPLCVSAKGLGPLRWHKGKPRKQADVVSPNFTALACFYGFSCCDASLRNEGCCFSVVVLPKLASKHADNRETTKGAAIASQQVFCWFWSKIIWMSVNPYLYENINSIIHNNLGWRIDEVRTARR